MDQELLSPLLDVLKIPSVSTLPEHESDMAKCRDFLISQFKALGFSTQILPGLKHPAVFASSTEASAKADQPTVLIYGHYDVQPPDPADQWRTPPFEPTIRDGQIFARGATDNKGQFMVHVMAAKTLVEKFGSNLLLNIKFLIEGEEEIGSPSIAGLAHKYAGLLKADYLVVSDTEMPSPGQPAIHTSLRGLLYTEIRLTTADSDAHSGQFGGVIENPAILLSRLVSQLKDSSNKVRIPGFYTAVASPTPEELADYQKTQPQVSNILHESTGYHIGGGESRYSLNERRWSRPTLDVNGLLAGFTGEGSKTIIPATAMAKISMRLVPDQDPDDIFKKFSAFAKSLVPKGVKLEIIRHADCLPYKAPTNHPVFNLAKKCLTKAFGKHTVFFATGGSIGAIPILTSALKNIPCLMLAMGNADDNLHAPNEHFSLVNYTKGIAAMTDFYTQLHSLDK